MFGAYRKTEKRNIDNFFHFSFARLNGIIEWADDTHTEIISRYHETTVYKKIKNKNKNLWLFSASVDIFSLTSVTVVDW